MIQISADTINERWDDLPYDLRDFILSDELLNTVESTCEANSITDSSEIYRLTNMKLYGLLTTDDFLSALSASLGVEKAKAISNSIAATIPQNIIDLIPPAENVSPPPADSTAPLIEIPKTPEINNMIPNIISPTPEETPPLVTPAIPESPLENVEPPIPEFPSSTTPPTETIPPPPVTEAAPEVAIPASMPIETPPEIPPAPKATPPQAVSPAPFMLHQEAEIQSVIESSPSAARFSPLRPEFYTPNLEEMRETKPSFAKLQFGVGISEAVPQATLQQSAAIISPSPENKPATSSFSIREPIPDSNVVNLKDLPL